MKKDINFLKEYLIAHRGFHNISKGIPENSMVAFKEAIDNNYIIELDIHLLKDKNIVVFHDDNLERMTGLNKKINEFTYSQIANLNLKNTDEHIPLLKDVLQFVDGKVPIIIELKYDSKYGKLENQLIKLLSQYNGKYAVKSFNPLSIYWFKKHSPNTIRGQLSYDYNDYKKNPITKFILKNMLFNFITKPDFISYGIKSLPNKKIAKIRKNKIILGWTIKNKDDLIYAQKYCDNYICENFDKLKE